MVKKRETKGSNDLSSESSSQRILLEEYRLLQNRFERNRDQGIARMNFFITATSVILGGVLVFGSGNNVPIIDFRVILLLALIILSAIGLDVFLWLVQRDISADRYERGLARIRHYFVALDPGIEEYFINNVVDIPTNNVLRKVSGMRGAAEIVESFLLSLSLTILSTWFYFAPEESIWLGITSTILIFIILEAYARRRLSAATKIAEKEIKFRTKDQFDV